MIGAKQIRKGVDIEYFSPEAGWKPTLHYTVAASRWAREGAFRCTRIIARHSGEQCRV